MPRTKLPTSRKAHGKNTTASEPKAPVLSLSDKAVLESLRRTQAAIKSGVPRLAPDGIPWPPVARVRGRGKLTRIEIRRATLIAMAESRGIDLAELEKSLTEKPRRQATKS